jgi:hypothetical protein
MKNPAHSVDYELVNIKGGDGCVKNNCQGITYTFLFLPGSHPGIFPESLFPIKYLGQSNIHIFIDSTDEVVKNI